MLSHKPYTWHIMFRGKKKKNILAGVGPSQEMTRTEKPQN